MKKEELFRIFRSPALISDKRVMIGVEEAEMIKESVVARNLRFAVEGRIEPPWMEAIVHCFREATIEPGFDHEFWGAWTLMPGWTQRIVSLQYGGWIDFPERPVELSPESLGAKVGFFLTQSEMKLNCFMQNEQFRESLKTFEWSKAVRGLNVELAKKVRVVHPGFDSLEQLAGDSSGGIAILRSTAFQVAGSQGMETASQFFKGVVAGHQRARKIDVVSEVSEYNLRMDVLDLLYEGWEHVADLETRAQVSEYLLEHLPDSKRAFFAADEERWESFQGGTLRDLFRQIGLNPARRGRPRKKRVGPGK